MTPLYIKAAKVAMKVNLNECCDGNHKPCARPAVYVYGHYEVLAILILEKLQLSYYFYF